jgi:hypothetical protein
MKFFQEVVHSCLTMEIRVALSFVRRGCSYADICSSSESLTTRVIMKPRMPNFWLSGIIFHFV